MHKEKYKERRRVSGHVCVYSFSSVLLKLILSLVFLFLFLPFPDFYYFSCALVSEIWFPDNLPRFCCTDKRVKHCDNRHHCCYEKNLIWFCPNTTFSWGYIWSFWKCLIFVFSWVLCISVVMPCEIYLVLITKAFTYCDDKNPELETTWELNEL